MVLDILFIILVWFLFNLVDGLPIALPILVTIFGSLNVLIKLIRFIYKNYKDKQNGTWGKF